ncbi:MAG: hypothetical protein JNK43_05390 [Ignavibacteria bacterium]|nr:hypothetical protein [Ignavibacteria bacterium]
MISKQKTDSKTLRLKEKQNTLRVHYFDHPITNRESEVQRKALLDILIHLPLTKGEWALARGGLNPDLTTKNRTLKKLKHELHEFSRIAKGIHIQILRLISKQKTDTKTLRLKEKQNTLRVHYFDHPIHNRESEVQRRAPLDILICLPLTKGEWALSPSGPEHGLNNKNRTLKKLRHELH